MLIKNIIRHYFYHDRFYSRGHPLKTEVALTFDDGPHPVYTHHILDVLRCYGIPATFFCTGSLLSRYPDVAMRIIAEGHFIESHTWSHSDLTKTSDMQNEIVRCSDTIRAITGMAPVFCRPPFGFCNPFILKRIEANDLKLMLWNIDPMDWEMPGTDAIVKRTLAHIGNGSIILLHDGSEGIDADRSQTVAALPQIIEGILQHGMSFVTLRQMTFPPKQLHEIVASIKQSLSPLYSLDNDKTIPEMWAMGRNVSFF